MEINELQRSLKRLIAGKGRPDMFYLKMFVAAAAKWLKQVRKDERIHYFLSTENIKWQFNLSRAPRWGGQFERLVGLVKHALQKSISLGPLTGGN